MPFPWTGIARENCLDLPAIPNSFKVDAQFIAMNGKEIPVQEEKVKGAAYAENSSVIEQPILWSNRIFIVVWPEKPMR